jgi:hypothetical protein
MIETMTIGANDQGDKNCEPNYLPAGVVPRLRLCRPKI